MDEITGKIKSWLSKYYLLATFIIITLVTGISLFIQIKARANFIYGDTAFHYNRFYDLYRQIKTGNFNYFQAIYGFNESGRMINAVYGPGFAFFNAMLLFICQSWFSYQILTDFLINLIAGFGFIHLSRKLNLNIFVSYIMMIIFLSTGYIPVWNLGNQLMSWGAAITPWIFAEAMNWIQRTTKQVKAGKLAILMAIVAQIHNLTLLIVAVALVIFFLIGLLHSKEKVVFLRNIGLSILIFLCLSANVIGGLLVLKQSQITMPQSVSLLVNVLSLNKFYSIRTGLSLVLLLLVFVQVVVALLVLRKKSKLNLLFAIMGAAFLFLGTRLFPWQIMQNIFPQLKDSFQAPFRFILIAYPLIFIGYGLATSILLKEKHILGKIMLSLATIAMIFFMVGHVKTIRENVANYNNDTTVIGNSWPYKVTKNRPKIRVAMHSKDKSEFLKLYVNAESDYLPASSSQNAGLLYGKEVIDREKLFKHQVLKNGAMQLSWYSKKSKKTQLPFVMYRQSQLTLNGKETKYQLGQLHVPTVTAKKGKNIAVLSFKTPVWFVIAFWITIISWILIIGYLIYKSVHKRRLFLLKLTWQ